MDVGCATGFFLDAARRDGWRVYGIELSDVMSQYAIQNFGLDIRRQPSTDAVFPDRFFDVITMWDVLEHLADPLCELREVRRMLKDQGLICLQTPNFGRLNARLYKPKWEHIHADHLFYYDASSLSKMLAKCGFEVCKMVTYGIGRPLNRLKLLFNRFGLAEWFLKRMNMCDLIEVYALKR